MKRIIFFAGVLLMLSTLASAQKTGADEKISAQIEKYSTYDWTANIDKIPDSKMFVAPNSVLIYNNESTRSKIKDAIEYELKARGYKKSESPDFYVTFKVLEQPSELVTYNGYEVVDFDTVRTKDNREKVSVKAGTVLINFIDAKTSDQVWQGYVSGLLTPDMVNSKTKVMQAISSVFHEFDYKAASAMR